MFSLKKIEIPESPAIGTGEEKTWKARVTFEYFQNEVRHILHRMREGGRVEKFRFVLDNYKLFPDALHWIVQ